MTPESSAISNELTIRPSRRWLAVPILAIPMLIGLRDLSKANQDFQVGMDYRMTYSAARAWLHGLDPYDDDALKQVWSSAGMPHATPPGLPQTPNVYPLTIAPVLAPLAALRFPDSLAIWLAVNAIAASMLGFFILKPVFDDRRSLARPGGQSPGDNSRTPDRLAADWLPYFGTAVLIFGFPLRYGLTFGNLAVVTTLLVVASIRWRDRPILSGALLGVALIKYTLAAPLALIFMVERRWRLIAVAATVQIVLVAIATIGYAGSPPQDWLPHMIASCAQSTAPGAVNDFAALDVSATHLDISALLYRLAPPLVGLRYVAMAIFVIVFIWAARCRPKDRRVNPAFEELRYMVALVLALVAVYHRVYDAILVIAPLAAWLVAHGDILTRRWRALLWIGLVFTMFAGCTVAGGRPVGNFALLALVQPICTWALLLTLVASVAGLRLLGIYEWSAVPRPQLHAASGA